jgi:hypothetical protein|nr:MAG TPA: Protein of unknown function (DUF1351) [Caudoviricetes sp.]DAS14628.1 MAG TPA: Protein of unknown function (DUF1351) [Caudoviricetes sp.]
MELTIFNPATNEDYLQEIKWNYEDIKAEVLEKLKNYQNLVYTDDQIPEAKADKARLNKLKEALDDKRKEIKKQCLMPYEKFEKQVKDILAIIDAPLILIDKQIKEYDEQKKLAKKAEIENIFESIEKPDFLELESIFNEKWLNATFSLKKVTEEITSAINKTKEDLQTLEGLTEYSFEAIEMYKTNLNINQALNQARYLVELAKRKAEEKEKKERERLAIEQARKQEEEEREKAKQADLEIDTKEPQTSEQSDKLEPTIFETYEDENIEREWIGFEVFVSMNEVLKIKEFFKSNNIEIRRV